MADEHYLKQEFYQRFKSDSKILEWIEQGSLDGLWYWDLKDSKHEWLSPKFMQTFGYGPDEIPHTSEWWQENIFPEDLPGVLDTFNKHLENPEKYPYDQVVRYRHKNGSTVWVRCRGLVTFDDEGQADRMIGAHTDVTPLMESQLSLQETKAHLERAAEVNRLALGASGIGIWTFYPSTKQLIWDDAMFTLYQLDKRQTFEGYEAWRQCVHPDDLAHTEQQLNDCINNGEDFEAVFRIVLPSGKLRYIHASAQVHRDENGEADRVLGANWDVTKEKEQALKLRRSNDDLSRFAYAASHDLKAPLRSVKQLTEWIESDLGNLSDDVSEYFSLLKGRVERMEILIDSLLDYAKINDSDSSSTVCVDTKALIDDVCELLAPPATLRLELHGRFPSINTYKSPLEQVLRNLIGNAIKHRSSDEGVIVIWLSEHLGYYSFHIADDGDLIPEGYKARIFEMFQTLRPKDQVEGSGMGLAIVKKILDNHGATIDLSLYEAGSKVMDGEGHASSPAALDQCNKAFSFTWPSQ